MTGIDLTEALPWALAAFFLLGGIVNWIAPARIRKDYERWRYPGWFHYVTGGLEIIAAILFIFPQTRIAGSILAIAIMGGAFATLIFHREYKHALLPALVLFLALVCGWSAT
ncbi:DoxX family protein [Pseudomonas sp. KFB-139]|uniref:DoxX family protein n=1 Tax=Pseudomonas serbiensis TaxID=3064350 RepID=A0ABT9CJH5_9PSED|nr:MULTISPECIES: DoxX family protein [Pseudomonas]MDO7925647.1 DoxX family protein [Pseudomonas sp. KFB-138]